jgi:predicted phosphodiesterase
VRLLCLSDIHGHARALSAVLATAERRGYQRVLVAGDICFPGPEPLATWRRLSQLRAVCAQGVGDRAIATVDVSTLRPRDDFERARLERLHDVRAELGDSILHKLAKLPPLVRQPLDGGRQLVMVHGSPVDPTEPLSHDMDDETVALMLGEEEADVVLCGGSHVPFDRTIEREVAGQRRSTRVVNLGSVGEAPGALRHDPLELEAAPSPFGADATLGPLGVEASLSALEATRASSRGVSRPRFAHATFVECSGGGIDVDQFVVPLGWLSCSIEPAQPAGLREGGEDRDG